MNEEKYFELVEQYPKTVILVKWMYFYSARGNGAFVISTIMNYKLNRTKKNNTPVAGGPSLEKIINRLEEKEIDYMVIKSNEILTRKNFPQNHFDNYIKNVENSLTPKVEMCMKNVSQIEKLKDVEILLNGINPWTGEIINEDDILNFEEMKILLATLKDFLIKDISPKGSSKQKPERAGNSWTTEEDEELKKEYENNIPIAKIAKEHKRTRGSIKSRMQRLGLID